VGTRHPEKTGLLAGSIAPVWFLSMSLRPVFHQISHQFIQELSFLIPVQDNASFFQEIIETIMDKRARL
jgi:hypothetical protein